MPLTDDDFLKNDSYLNCFLSIDNYVNMSFSIEKYLRVVIISG